ncbi:MAG: AI-2E family transporter [Ginsengibacter sp.]
MSNSESKKVFSKRVWIATSIVSLSVVSLLLFKTLFSTLLLVLAAVMVALFFHGVASLIHRKLNISYRFSVIMSVIINLLLISAFFWFTGSRLQGQIAQLSDTLPATIEHTKQQLMNTTIGKKAMEFLSSSGNSQKTLSVVKRFFSSSFGILSDFYIILLMAAFFIASPGIYKKGIVHLLPPAGKKTGDHLLNELGRILKNWLKGQIFGFFFIAVLTGLGLWALDMPLVLTLALIAGLLNFIPNFGPIIALVPAILIALTMGQTTAILVACLYTFIQVIQSAVTQPLIQKKMMNIPPALIIFGQVAMGLLGGFWGVLLATPLIAIIMKIVNSLYVEKQDFHLYRVKEIDQDS